MTFDCIASVSVLCVIDLYRLGFASLSEPLSPKGKARKDCKNRRGRRPDVPKMKSNIIVRISDLLGRLFITSLALLR